MLPRWVWDFIRATAGDGGYAEVRGWKLDAVAPKYCSRPSVSDVTSPCPTKRDVYLRRSLKVRVESEILSLGKAVHEAFLYPHRRRGEDVERLIYGFRRALKQYQDLKRHWRLLEVKFTWRVVRVDDSLRRRFLDARDEVARILEYGDDPGTPPSCPSMCPYRGVCLSENTLRSRAGL